MNTDQKLNAVDYTSAVKISIVRFVDRHQPGFVEAELTDAWGKRWRFVEKVPVIALTDLDETSEYPQPGIIGCQVVRSWRDSDGRELVMVDTELPWHIESIDGKTRFEVMGNQLTRW